MNEIWVDIVGFVGYYEVSDLGNVRRKGKTKNLAKVIDKDGYVVHCFSMQNIRYNVMAHQLVNEAFNGIRPTGCVTRHKDNVRTNNVSTNLHWGTNAENSKDMTDADRQVKGEKSHLSKLTEKDILQIRSATQSQFELAKQFNVSQGNISQIINRSTWKHI